MMTQTPFILGAALSVALIATPALAQTELSLWYHGAGNKVEREILTGIIDDFNGSQSDWKVVLEEFPQAAYNDSVTAAALSNRFVEESASPGSAAFIN